MRTQVRCRKCGEPKSPGRCKPCRAAYLRAWARANRARRAAQARVRYEGDSAVRESSKQRSFRWRRTNRAHYLMKKREQNNRQRARARQERAAGVLGYA